MARYILGKVQINRLLDGKYVVDGRGRKYYAGDDLKGFLKQLKDYNLYDKYNVVIEDGNVDILEKV